MNYIGVAFSFIIPGMVIGGTIVSIFHNVKDAIAKHKQEQEQEQDEALIVNRIGSKWLGWKVGE